MKTVAFIPVRGGSKSIKNKNIMPLKGKPLVFYAIKAAYECAEIDKIYVSTDSQIITKEVNRFGFDLVEVVSRSPETATDGATSESALIEFCNLHQDFDRVVFLQATSPLTIADDLTGALKKMDEVKADSLISAVHRYQFLWNTDGTPMNYDPHNRPRRQDWDGYLVENGAFYISGRQNILSSNCRVSGKITYYEMPQETLIEVDEPEDWAILEKFL